jgi:hypothetical protein
MLLYRSAPVKVIGDVVFSSGADACAHSGSCRFDRLGHCVCGEMTQ